MCWQFGLPAGACNAACWDMYSVLAHAGTQDTPRFVTLLWQRYHSKMQAGETPATRRLQLLAGHIAPSCSMQVQARIMYAYYLQAQLFCHISYEFLRCAADEACATDGLQLVQGCAAHSRVLFARPASTDAGFARFMKEEVCFPACSTLTRHMLQLLRMQLEITVLAGRIQCCCSGAEMCDQQELIFHFRLRRVMRRTTPRRCRQRTTF